MTRGYVPLVGEHSSEFQALLAAFDGMTRADERLLLQRVIENRVSLEGLRALLAAPRALARAIDDLRVQRPFGTLRDYVGHGYGNSDIVRSWLRADGVAQALFSPRSSEGRDLAVLSRLDRLAEVLSSELREFHGSWRVAEGEMLDDEQLLARRTVAMPYVSLGDAALELPHLLGLVRESFASAGLHFGWRPDVVQDLLRRLEGRAQEKPSEKGVELLRFGLLETSYGDGEREAPDLRAKLPAGARFAGLETFVALAAYPRLLTWINSGSTGGSGVAYPSLWLLGSGPSEDRHGGTEYLRMASQASGPFRLPRIDPPILDSLPASDDHGREQGFIPYVIPVRSYAPAELSEKAVSGRL